MAKLVRRVHWNLRSPQVCTSALIQRLTWCRSLEGVGGTPEGVGGTFMELRMPHIRATKLCWPGSFSTREWSTCSAASLKMIPICRHGEGAFQSLWDWVGTAGKGTVLNCDCSGHLFGHNECSSELSSPLRMLCLRVCRLGNHSRTRGALPFWGGLP